MNTELTYSEWLKAELVDRKSQNPHYSLRAFARDLGVSAATLSQVISGKRPLSRKAATRIAAHPSLSPRQRKEFLSTIISDVAVYSDPEASTADSFRQLREDTFRCISDWQHYAILSLGNLRPNQKSPAWIADQLGISEGEAKAAYDRLLRLGLIKQRGRGFFQSSQQVSVISPVPSTAIRKYHDQNLRRAANSLARDPLHLRDFSSITVAADERKLPKAVERIRQFRRELAKLLESGQGQRVYTLSVQLFPASKNVETNRW